MFGTTVVTSTKIDHSNNKMAARKYKLVVSRKVPFKFSHGQLHTATLKVCESLGNGAWN